MFILRVYQKHMFLVDKNRHKLMLMLMMLMMLKNRSSLSSSLALAKAKAASINWMQLLTDLQASLQICRSSGSTSKLMLFMIELMEQAFSKSQLCEGSMNYAPASLLLDFAFLSHCMCRVSSKGISSLRLLSFF